MGLNWRVQLLFISGESDSIVATPPITLPYLWKGRTVEKNFHISSVNCDAYFREVRRALFTHMFSTEKVSLGRYLAFCKRYKNEGGIYNKVCGQPKFDAWCLVRGCSRNVFNHKRFFTKYPACYEQIKRLRGLLDIVIDDNFI